MTGVDPKPGDWVHIRAQVVDATGGTPENVCVELFSKTDQYLTAVRRDLVVEIVPKPRSLHELELTENTPLVDVGYVRMKFRCPDCDLTGGFTTSPAAKAEELFAFMSTAHQETA